LKVVRLPRIERGRRCSGAPARQTDLVLHGETLLEERSGTCVIALVAGDGSWNAFGLDHRSEIHEDHAIGEALADILGNGERQAGLAHAACAGERHQACPAQHAGYRGQLMLAPHEACPLGRQIHRTSFSCRRHRPSPAAA